MAEAWIIDSRGQHSGPIAMNHPRKGHTASVLPGPDTLSGTEDDIIVLIGGWDGTSVRNDAEALVTDSTSPRFLPLQINGNLTPRFEHNAHVIASADEIVLVGGRLEGELNGVIEVVALDTRSMAESDSVPARAFQVGELAYPRHQHSSILFEDSEDPLLFVYGGYGGSLGAPYVKFTAEYCRVLSSPECPRHIDTSKSTPMAELGVLLQNSGEQRLLERWRQVMTDLDQLQGQWQLDAPLSSPSTLRLRLAQMLHRARRVVDRLPGWPKRS